MNGEKEAKQFVLSNLDFLKPHDIKAVKIVVRAIPKSVSNI